MKLTYKIRELFSHFNNTRVASAADQTYALTDDERLSNKQVVLHQSSQTQVPCLQRDVTATLNHAASYEPGRLGLAKLAKAPDHATRSNDADNALAQGLVMSEEDFLDLLPANGYFH